MVAINGTSTGYLGTALAPSIDSEEWAIQQLAFGERYFVEKASSAKVTVVSGTTVRVAVGRIGGWGIVDTFTGTRDLPLPTPGSDETVHYTVVARRTWQATNATTIEYVTGTATRAVAAAVKVNSNPAGVQDDHPLALVAVTKSGSTVTASVVDDLRVVGGHGNYEASSELVLTTTGYMQEPGYRIRIAGNQWTRLMDGSWNKVTPVEVTSSFGSSPDGWSTSGTQYPSQIVRDGRRRTMDLETRRNGGVITPNGKGQIGNDHVFTVAEGDKPMRQTALTGTYLVTNGGDAPATGYVDTNGRVYLAALTDDLVLAGASAGGWSLRLGGDWYTA